MAEEEPKPLTYIPEVIPKKRKSNEVAALKRKDQLSIRKLNSKKNEDGFIKLPEGFVREYRSRMDSNSCASENNNQTLPSIENDSTSMPPLPTKSSKKRPSKLTSTVSDHFTRLTTSMSLIAGSYERFIWGFKLKPAETQTLSLTPLFSYPSHLSAVRTLATAGPVAASGGADDTIHLYDLSIASSLGSLHDHSASLTALSFYTPPNLSFPRNLISAAADGSICIYDADPFVHLKTVFTHKKAVNDLSIHPSGKLALTVGRDECLAMINLVRGRRSFYCRLGKEASLVNFDVVGDKFSMVMEEKVSVHEAEDAQLLCEFENKKRVLCSTPCENDILLTGGEDRCLTAWDVKSGKVAYSIEEAHAARVKGIVVFTKNSSDAFSNDDAYIVASASSDGVIRVWDVRMAIKGKPNPLAEANTKSRLTCLAGSTFKSLRRP